MTNALKTHSLEPTHVEETAIEFAERIVRQSGSRMTRIRRHVYMCLLKSDRPLRAYDILDMLDGIGAQKPPTVYRALDWLIKMRLVKKVASVSKYVALQPQKGNQTVAFLLCQKCGQTESFDPGPMTESLKATAQKNGFDNCETVIEIVGNCKGHRP